KRVSANAPLRPLHFSRDDREDARKGAMARHEQNQNGVPATLTVEEAAKLLGISRGLAYESARRGEIPTIRLGRRVLVPRSRLLAMLEEEDDTPSAGESEP